MNTSMTVAPTRVLRSGGTAADVDRLLMTVSSALRDLPERRRFVEISMPRFLALYARRQHGSDLAAATRTLNGAVARLGNPHTPITPATLATRIRLSRRSVRPVGGAR